MCLGPRLRVGASVAHVTSPLSEENTPLDLDDHGGRTFLRVLLHLTMHDYPPLVSGALQLLFRHFSQRQEVLQAFKQVAWVAVCAHMCVCVRYWWWGRHLSERVLSAPGRLHSFRFSCSLPAKMSITTSRSNKTWTS